MKCDKHAERLSALADGELSERSARGLEQHIEECSECREELRVLRALKNAIREHTRSVEPPSGFWLGVRARMTELEQAARHPSRRIFFLPPIYAAAAVVVLTLAMGAIIWQAQERPLATSDVLLVPLEPGRRGFDPSRFAGEVGFRPVVPQVLPQSGAQLVGMVSRRVRGQDIASLFYDLDGTPIVVNEALFYDLDGTPIVVNEALGPGFSGPNLRPVIFKGRTYRYTPVDGQNIIIWDNGPIKFMLHGNAPLETLLSAADELR